MKNKYKKGAFLITLVLFLIFLPLTVLSIIYKKGNVNDNPDKLFHYNNKLYFYNKGQSLIGTYSCQYKNCGYATQLNEDSQYGIDSYIDYDNNSNRIINDNYAFIADYKNQQNAVYLYDIKNNDSSLVYKSYKDYGVGISGNYYIIQTISGKYGVVKIEDKIENTISTKYDYIAVGNNIDPETNKLSSSLFIAEEDGKWVLLDANENQSSSTFDNPIVGYDDKTLIVKIDDNYSIYDHNGSFKMYGTYKKLKYISKYIEVIDSYNNYYIYDLDTLSRVSKTYTLTDSNVVTTKVDENKNIVVIIDGEEKETIEI